MKISRERIEEIRLVRDTTHKVFGQAQGASVRALNDALDAIDERDELLAKAITSLDWMTDYCTAPNPVNEARERIVAIREMVRGSKWEHK